MTRWNPLRGARGWVLLPLAGFAATRALAYVPSNQPAKLPGALDLISAYVPLSAYVVGWFLAAVLLLTASVCRRADTIAIVVLSTMWVIWGGAYLAAWVIACFNDETSREWLNASTYLFPWLAVIGLLTRSAVSEQPAVAHE
ncbi:hypothetical protein [Kribbella sp. CA-293567]|uniref:hypothetical protein n=1 Tax=Kribbella sp. CA-293567 TaxID=3002436 RepID=UPI0022DDB621|nr:hypothetical protein [Kribbella sp. CA-293567]WBQ03033.1 hypothetical protein OX958_23985 [Kribbella sp. CA-293567]